MNTEEKINRAVELFQSLGLSEITLKDGDFAIELKRSNGVSSAAALPIASAPAVEAPAASVSAQPAMIASASAPASATVPVTVNGSEVKAPMLGVFYAASSPDAAPFVKVGDRVKKGDILCIIEAMKMMNEITAEEDGTVAEIKAENGKIVEFGQVLFVLN